MFLGVHEDGEEEKFEKCVFIIKLENEVKRADKSRYIVQRVQILTEGGKIKTYQRMFQKYQVRKISLGEVAIPWSLFSEMNNKGEEKRTKQIFMPKRIYYHFYDEDYSKAKKTSTLVPLLK